jgi:hypothetical protein
MEDLPLTVKFEPAENLKYLNQYNLQLQSIIAEQQLNLNTLISIYYLGSYDVNMAGSSLKRSLEWNIPLLEEAPIFKSDIYKGYFSTRTQKVLEQHKTSEDFNYANFTKTGRQDFDNYIKTALKDENSRIQLITLLQGKLYDKLIELEPAKRKALLDETLALGLPENSSNAIDCIYQLFESRVRLQMFSQMVDINKQKIQHLNQRIGLVITAEKKGQLMLQSKNSQSKDKAVQIMNLLENEEGYRGYAALHELYSKDDYKLIFTEESGSVYEVELEKAIAAITINKNGFVHIDLESLLAEKQDIKEDVIPTKPTTSNNNESQLKSLEMLYLNKSKAAKEIVKELNRYSIYLELKDKKISNIYTRSFESKQKVWKKDLESKLNSFGTGGMADFMAYIKQFELLDRKSIKQDKENQLIVKFRNTDIQFRKTEDGSIWISNMLYKVKYMK